MTSPVRAARRAARWLVVAGAASLMFVAGAAFAAEEPPAPNAAAALVAEGVDGELLWRRAARKPLPIASITKIMTALVVLDRTKLTDTVVVSERAAQIGEATAGLRPGERLTVEQLLTAMLVTSANDAANALADHVGRRGGVKRFVTLMNRKAEAIGMRDTQFVRPDGLDVEGHVSSASDVMILARRAMQNQDFRRIVQLQEGALPGGRGFETTNDLLRSYAGATGVKTGHTSDAGWSQAASARREGVQLYAVILGGPSRERRNSDLAALLDWGFQQFGRVDVVHGGAVYARSKIPFDDDRRLDLVADRSVSRIVQWDEALVERVVAPAMVSLPVVAGQELGSVQVMDGDEVIAERPLIATESISAATVSNRANWYLRQALDHASDAFGRVLGVLP